MKALLLAGVVAIGWTASAIAVPFTLTNGTGEGQVTVGVDGFGSFGRLLSVGSTSSTDAFYRPIGAAAAAGTVYQSGVAIRLDMTGARTFLSTGLGGAGLGAGLSNPAVTGTGLGAQSSFTFNGLTFQLSQSLVSLFQSGVQNGSRLDQTYTITNNGSSAARSSWCAIWTAT